MYNHKNVYYLFMFAILIACKSGPNQLQYDKDNCDFCKMKLVDEKYGAELITEKGRVYKFDDIGCMLNYEIEKLGLEKVSQELVIDYSNRAHLIEASKAIYLKGEGAKSPMGSNIAAFEKEETAKQFIEQINSEKFSWNDIKKNYPK